LKRTLNLFSNALHVIVSLNKSLVELTYDVGCICQVFHETVHSFSSISKLWSTSM